jgi:hypothetical protein
VREPTTPDDISPDYLMGCINALATVIAMVAKKLPPDQQESIINDVAKVHIAFEARWKSAPVENPTRKREVGVSDTYGLFLSKVLDEQEPSGALKPGSRI